MLPRHLVPELYAKASPVIAGVLTHGGAPTGSKPSGEVSAVRAMTLYGFDQIAAAWSPILKKHGYRIDLRAVFCHSRPHVTFRPVPHPKYSGGTTLRRCELADLLIVIDHIDLLKKIDDRYAVLVQAKMLKGGDVKLSDREWVQHELLAWLPSFTFVDPGYDPRSRNLKGVPRVGEPAYTAEYGGIDLKSSPPEWRHELTRTTAPWFSSPIPLACYLAKMATGATACGRQAVRGGSDDWSFTVDELLRVTAARPITKKITIARGNDNVVGFIADASSLAGAGDGGGGDHLEGEIPEWHEGPISTIHMTLYPIDDRRE